jgi:hypothetical protein
MSKFKKYLEAAQKQWEKYDGDMPALRKRENEKIIANNKTVLDGINPDELLGEIKKSMQYLDPSYDYSDDPKAFREGHNAKSVIVSAARTLKRKDPALVAKVDALFAKSKFKDWCETSKKRYL